MNLFSKLTASSLIVVLLLHSEQYANAEIPTGSIGVRLELVATGFESSIIGNNGSVDQLVAVDMTPLGDGRQLVLTLGGVVRLLDTNKNLVAGSYLDTFNGNSFPATGERGPTGIEAHPDFLNPGTAGYGKFYTLTNEVTAAGGVDFGVNNHHQNVLTEWTVANPLDTSASTFSGTSRSVLRVGQPGEFHDVFDMAFDSNKLMYITSGDGGGFAYGKPRQQNSQDNTNIYGTVLRVDPVQTTGPGLTTSANGQYGIPDTNFGAADGDSATLAEIFAYGMRSPYRISVDLLSDEVWIGDVGEGAREEIDLILNGGNYGWGNREGTLGSHPPGGSIDPLYELYHTDTNGIHESVTITGGFVSRDPSIPELNGKYIFADFGELDANNVGEIFYGDPNTDGSSTRDDFFKLIIDTTGEPLPERIYSIAQDEHGSLYLLGGPDRFNFNNGTPGTILKLVPTAGPPNGIHGDVNQDGVLDEADGAAFALGWHTIGHIGAYEKYTHGDLNFDGFTDLRDAFLLHEAFVAPPLSKNIPVPEPTSLWQITICLLVSAGIRRGSLSLNIFLR